MEGPKSQGRLEAGPAFSLPGLQRFLCELVAVGPLTVSASVLAQEAGSRLSVIVLFLENTMFNKEVVR